jgi:hypothetical protein
MRVQRLSVLAGDKYVGNGKFLNWTKSVVHSFGPHESPLVYRQLFEQVSSTYTYLIADKKSGVHHEHL